MSNKMSLLEQNLIKKGNFKLWSFNDYFGIISMNSVLDININCNENYEKENITVMVDSPEIFKIKAGDVIAYKTNSSYNPNIITDKFNMTFIDKNNNNTNKEFSCYLKKSNDQNNLILLCSINEEGSFILATQEQVLNQIHYKYNFHIFKKEEDKVPFNVTGRGSQILLTYPYSLNLTSEESVTLKYLMDYPTLEENILITQNNVVSQNDTVTCSNYGKVKMCKVPISFFEGKNTGYFYTYHSLNSDQSDYALFYESTPFNFILPPNNLIIMRIKYQDNAPNIYLGNNGVITFKTNYNDITKNIFNEADIPFITYVTDKDKNTYNVNCTLWNPGNENLRIFCKLNENLKKENQLIILNEVNLNYKGCNIIILPETYVTVYQRNYNIPFLYSEKQNIELNDKKEEYELKFRIYSYNNELIYLDNYFILDQCKIQTNELICTIQKKKLIEKLRNLGVYKLYYLIEEIEYDLFDSVLGINIKYENIIKKEDIYVNITKLLTNTYDYIGLATYETTSNSVPDIETDTFTLYFSNNNTQEPFTCYFGKHEPFKLLLFCFVSSGNNYALSKIETRKIFNNIHYKYNFIIEPVENNETINVYDNNVRIYNVYPNNIDFLWQDSANIIYFINDKINIKGLRLDPDLDNLECASTSWGILTCKVSLSYFKNKTEGYFFIYHQDGNGHWQILYEANPIYIRIPKDNNIILRIKEEDNKDMIKVGLNGTLYFVLDDETSTSIFNSSDIEDLSFPAFIYDKTGNANYGSSCRLWKPENEKLRMFCKLFNSFANSFSMINIGETEFTYKNYTVLILSKNTFAVNQLKDHIYFLFADKQEINIKEEVDFYPIIFNYESDEYETLYNSLKLKQSFDKRNFYLYKNDMRAIILQNCEGKNNKLTCNINKDKISQFLSYSGEKFYLAEKLDSEGLYLFNSVLDIKINYIVTQKEISLKIGNLLTHVISKNEFIAYETNKGDISSLTTDYFELQTEQNKKFNCIFKKNNNVNNMLLLCNATEDGKYSLGKISTITYDKININYKFIIEQSENKEEFTVEDNGTKIFDLNPLELNFKEKDSYVIKYETEYPERLNGIKLNNDSSFELSCENKIWYKECIVNKTHFTKSGYYYTYHNNYLGLKTISYEAPLIHAIMEEKGNNSENEEGNSALVIGLSIAGGILVLCAIGFLVWHCLRKRTNADIESGNKDDLLPLSSQEKE